MTNMSVGSGGEGETGGRVSPPPTEASAFHKDQLDIAKYGGNNEAGKLRSWDRSFIQCAATWKDMLQH